MLPYPNPVLTLNKNHSPESRGRFHSAGINAGVKFLCKAMLIDVDKARHSLSSPITDSQLYLLHNGIVNIMQKMAWKQAKFVALLTKTDFSNSIVKSRGLKAN